MESPFAGTSQPGTWHDVASLPRPIAFALGGGAASGASQVGMLRALRDAGVEPDMIVGTSVGAINGAMACAQEWGVDRLVDVWCDIDKMEILGSSGIRCLPRLFRTRRHLFPPDALRSLIRRNIPARHFDGLDVAFAAVATHIGRGEATVLRSGDLETALLASAAIPGVFPRVEIDGEWYFDGGVTANLPVRQAIDLGAATVIVLDAAPQAGEREQPANIAETLQYVAGLLMRSQVSCDLAALGQECHLVTLPRTTPTGIGPFDFSRSRELIELAYRVARTFLQTPPDLAAAAR